jgi:hypothetical protein
MRGPRRNEAPRWQAARKGPAPLVRRAPSRARSRTSSGQRGRWPHLPPGCAACAACCCRRGKVGCVRPWAWSQRSSLKLIDGAAFIPCSNASRPGRRDHAAGGMPSRAVPAAGPVSCYQRGGYCCRIEGGRTSTEGAIGRGPADAAALAHAVAGGVFGERSWQSCVCTSCRRCAAARSCCRARWSSAPRAARWRAWRGPGCSVLQPMRRGDAQERREDCDRRARELMHAQAHDGPGYARCTRFERDVACTSELGRCRSGEL